MEWMYLAFCTLRVRVRALQHCYLMVLAMLSAILDCLECVRMLPRVSRDMDNLTFL